MHWWVLAALQLLYVVPGQAVGQVDQCVISGVCIARAALRLGAQVVQKSSPRLICPCDGAAPQPLWNSLGVISSLTAILCPVMHLLALRWGEEFVSPDSVRGRLMWKVMLHMARFPLAVKGGSGERGSNARNFFPVEKLGVVSAIQSVCVLKSSS